MTNKLDETAITSTITASSTATKNEDDEEDWVKPTSKDPKFPYCYVRRAPYFWFNRLCFLFSLGFFLFISHQIIEDYIQQKENPPTSTTYKSGLTQDFPGMAFCMHQTPKAYQPDLEPLFALYDNGSTNGGNGIDITTKLKRTECNGTYSSNSNGNSSDTSTLLPTINSSSTDGVLQPARCWYIDD